MGIADLAEERKAYAIGHPGGDSSMRFLARREGHGATTHGIDPAAFDGLDPEAKAKGWGAKVGTLRTQCGIGPVALSDLVAAYALPLCPPCRLVAGGHGRAGGGG